ncbi:hypothetical protein Back2_23590 [Nocardioides baekrokdamisoli]|uniref:Ribonuclease VapC n=1 Tax=Nocardioides baekrokdamisoli TaxID=1804624 RepID=A0A3G9IIT6_9ACTN|nr:PIN domain-containing protein [Nocardioides baekrokdamisoli]BBH18072.1 hypothetical protein Back2_23590 [Nocardioides baekrokdamisoli]
MTYAILDSNVILTLLDGRAGAEAARSWLDGERGPLATTPQVLREVLAVSTRPRDRNGLGHSHERAVGNVGAVSRRLKLLPDTAAVASRLRALVAEGRAAGNQIHDANIVASALVHDAERIVTANVKHFARFADLIEIVPLAERV